MSFQLTQRVIKLLCGRISYERGEAYYRAGKVIFQQIDHASRVYAADVSGTGLYHVSVQIDQHGDVHAECNCPAFYTYTNYCKHIAAVLLGVHDLQQNGKPRCVLILPCCIRDLRRTSDMGSAGRTMLWARPGTPLPKRVRLKFLPGTSGSPAT